MKFQLEVEHGREKFVKFYVEADVVDGKVLRYSFSSLVEDIRRTCGSLPKCVSPPCPSHDACGLRDKHPELKLKISELQKEIKRLQQEHCDAESKLKTFCESRVKASTSFFAVMRPRLKVRNLIKYSDRVFLDRYLLILKKH